jgi:hypothetical protein
LRLPPFQSVTSVTYYDFDEVQYTMSSTLYQTDLTSRPGLIQPTFAQVIWPVALRRLKSVAATFVCGYGGPESVPFLAKQAIFLHVGANYRMREMGPQDTTSYDNTIDKLRWRKF